MYSFPQLYGFVRNLEDFFTEGFSYNKLCVDSILDMLDMVKARLHWEAGRTLHSETDKRCRKILHYGKATFLRKRYECRQLREMREGQTSRLSSC